MLLCCTSTPGPQPPRLFTMTTVVIYENGVKVQVFNEEIECKSAEETDV